MPNYQKNIVYLSEEQRQTLFTNGSITVNGTTVIYDDNDMYVTPQAEPVIDVQVNGTSVLSNGTAAIPSANKTTFGVIKVGSGLYNSNGTVGVNDSNDANIKAGNTGTYTAVQKQHQATFYGLAKAAGADEKDSALSVGTYTETAKTAIRNMLGAASTNIVAVQDEQPTDTDTKVWLPGTQAAGVEVPTMADMNTALAGKVSDMQVNGTSVVTNGVANVPIADENTLGAVRGYFEGGTQVFPQTGQLLILAANGTNIKQGTHPYKPIVPERQHESTFYGLAKAAGDTTQSASSNTVGTYTAEAKSAIQSMLGIDLQSIASEVEIPLVETVSGTTPSITGQPNTRYVCGEVSTLSITPPSAGSIDVIFDSGSTAAVITVPNTVRWPAWFDATALEADTTYEILITDGVYGSVMTWEN